MSKFSKSLKSFIQIFVPQSYLCLKEGYSFKSAGSDLFAGITVGIVAIPLATAFAIASGATPEQGLITAIVAGFIISILSGSRVQIGGPTGAFVVVVLEIITRHGYSGLVTATFMAGILLIIMALLRLGNWIKFIPYPLTTGFTTGIAVIIFSSQMKDFLGLKNLPQASNFLEQWKIILSNLGAFDFATLALSVSTLGLILLIRKYIPALPWGVVSIVLMTSVVYYADLPVSTIESKFGSLKGDLSSINFFLFDFSLEKIQKLFPAAVTIALLAGIESLLCAIVADGMTGRKHKSNCELMAQGIANIASSFIGGIPATGAIARTATNIKCGGKTPLAGIVHALTIFVIFVYLGPMVSKIPLACLSAVLIMVAWNMAELKAFFRLTKAPLGDVAVLFVTFLLTIFIDITVAVQVGMIIASFIFVKRMGDKSEVKALHAILSEEDTDEKYDREAIEHKRVPNGVEVYEVSGPLFFAVADSVRDILKDIQPPPKLLILRMRKASTIDASGLNSLDDLHDKCKKQNIHLVLSGVRKDIYPLLNSYGLVKKIGKENIYSSIDDALKGSAKFIKKL